MTRIEDFEDGQHLVGDAPVPTDAKVVTSLGVYDPMGKVTHYAEYAPDGARWSKQTGEKWIQHSGYFSKPSQPAT